VIDLHCHILPGLDDGARDLQDSVEMASRWRRTVSASWRRRRTCGTTTRRRRHRFAAALARVRDAVRAAGVELDVRGGAEVALGRLERLTREELARLGLGGNPRLLLLEYPYHGRPPALARDCGRLRQEGTVPVIAHPERNAEVRERPQDLEEAVAAGDELPPRSAKSRRQGRVLGRLRGPPG